VVSTIPRTQNWCENGADRVTHFSRTLASFFSHYVGSFTNYATCDLSGGTVCVWVRPIFIMCTSIAQTGHSGKIPQGGSWNSHVCLLTFSRNFPVLNILFLFHTCSLRSGCVHFHGWLVSESLNIDLIFARENISQKFRFWNHVTFAHRFKVDFDLNERIWIKIIYLILCDSAKKCVFFVSRIMFFLLCETQFFRDTRSRHTCNLLMGSIKPLTTLELSRCHLVTRSPHKLCYATEVYPEPPIVGCRKNVDRGLVLTNSS